MATLLIIYMLLCSLAVPLYGAVKLFKYLKIKQYEKQLSKSVTNISTPAPEEVLEEVSEDAGDALKNIFGNFEIGGNK